MKFYFDAEELNLSCIPEIKEIRPFHYFRNYYNVGNAEFCYTTDYQEPGVYLIEVSKLTHQWTGKNRYSHSFDVFSNIPAYVIDAVKNKKLRIVIISIVEGDGFVKEYWDAFKALTKSVKDLDLPINSVLIVSGNVRADEEYKQWCAINNQLPMIEFIGGTEGLSSIPQIDKICAKNVIDNNSQYLYSSLNRANRESRTEHLFFLADRNILNKGLVSGGAFFNEQLHPPKFLNIDFNPFVDVLKSNYPKTVDVELDQLKTINQAHNINLDIYNNAMLSVVTETYFDELGLYFSEKMFKPISVGSPQIVLGQPHAIRYIKDKFNIDLNFSGIDSSFDNIENPKERFIKFHETLYNWVNIDEVERNKIFINLFEQLEHNLNTFRNTNFKKIIVDDIIKSTENYLKGN